MGIRDRLLRRSVAWPSDHGSWVFLLSPLIIGLAIGGRWTEPVTYLIVASICGFLVRQPMTIAVKALSGRRSRADLPAALFWSALYSLIGLAHVLGLILRGMGYLLYLAIPGILVFAWYLYLVWRRGERRQFVLEIVGAGVFALTAPAGLWAAVGHPVGLGWLLWMLTWAQSTASIVYVYLRLQQRSLTQAPTPPRRLLMGLPSLTLTSLNLLGVGALGADGLLSQTLAVAYIPQWIEALWGTCQPAIGVKPSRIGVRQLCVSTLYTLLFIWTW
jgi:hypothetical protein